MRLRRGRPTHRPCRRVVDSDCRERPNEEEPRIARISRIGKGHFCRSYPCSSVLIRGQELSSESSAGVGCLRGRQSRSRLERNRTSFSRFLARQADAKKCRSRRMLGLRKARLLQRSCGKNAQRRASSRRDGGSQVVPRKGEYPIANPILLVADPWAKPIQVIYGSFRTALMGPDRRTLTRPRPCRHCAAPFMR